MRTAARIGQAHSPSLCHQLGARIAARNAGLDGDLPLPVRPSTTSGESLVSSRQVPSGIVSTLAWADGSVPRQFGRNFWGLLGRCSRVGISAGRQVPARPGFRYNLCPGPAREAVL